MKNNQGFAHIFVVIAIMIGIAVISTAFLANFKNRHLMPKQNTPSNQILEKFDNSNEEKKGYGIENSDVLADLPNCSGNNVYSVSPVPLESLDFILPLGNINPSGHSTPSDHIYLVLKRTLPGNDAPPDVVNIFAPGDMIIYTVGRQTKTTNGKIDNIDYFLSFAPCKEISGSFGHVSELDGQLASGINFSDCNSYTGGTESTYEQCRAKVNIKVKAGEKIGTAGGKSSAALDFNAYDERLPNPVVANPKRTINPHATCPINYYSEQIKTKLESLLGGKNGRRTVEPICGEIFQDKIGTLQGNWYIGNDANDWTKYMAMVHDHIDPTIGLVSIGGTISEPGVFSYTPQHSGTINREPSEINPEGQIYCYEPKAENNNNTFPGRFIVQLVDVYTLKAEFQLRSCDSNIKFNSPTIYER